VDATGIVVVDDHRAFVTALTARLEAEPGFEVIGTADSLSRALSVIERTDPDIVLLDVELGDDDGASLIPIIREGRPRAHVVVVTAHDDVATATGVVRAGATSFVAKDAPVEVLVSAIRGASSGESFIPARLLAGVLSELMRNPEQMSEEEKLVARLTPRER